MCRALPRARPARRSTGSASARPGRCRNPAWRRVSSIACGLLESLVAGGGRRIGGCQHVPRHHVLHELEPRVLERVLPVCPRREAHPPVRSQHAADVEQRRLHLHEVREDEVPHHHVERSVAEGEVHHLRGEQGERRMRRGVPRRASRSIDRRRRRWLRRSWRPRRRRRSRCPRRARGRPRRPRARATRSLRRLRESRCVHAAVELRHAVVRAPVVHRRGSLPARGSDAGAPLDSARCGRADRDRRRGRHGTRPGRGGGGSHRVPVGGAALDRGEAQGSSSCSARS